MSAILQLTVKQEYYGQVVNNVFWYRSDDDQGTITLSRALTEAFGVFDSVGTPGAWEPAVGTPMRNWAYAVHEEVKFRSITVLNPYDDTDFYSVAFQSGASGKLDTAGSGDPMPPTVALGYRSGRVRRDIGRGYKRFVGITENAVDGGGVLQTAYLNNEAEGLRIRLGAILSYNDEGANKTFDPVIVGKRRVDEEDGASLSRPKYILYPTLGEQLEHIVRAQVWETYTTTRTQNSRQYGRGR